MAAIIAALVNHPRVIIISAAIALLMFGAYALYRAGERHATTQMQAASAIVAHSADSAIALATGKLLTVKRENDSLRTKADSMNHIVAEKHTAANLVNDRLVLHGDTATIKTDTGVVAVPIPEILTKQIALMVLNNRALQAAQDRRHEADSALVVGLTVQVHVDSAMDVAYRKQLAAIEARAAADEAKPQPPRLVWFLTGVATTAVAVAVAVVAH